MKSKSYGSQSVSATAKKRVEAMKGSGMSQSAKNIQARDEAEKSPDGDVKRGKPKPATKKK